MMKDKSFEIIIAGTGAGSESLVTPEVMEAIENSERIIAHSSRLNLIPEHKNFTEYKNFYELEKIFSEIHDDFLLLVSGDPGLFSLMPVVRKKFSHCKFKILPGISSLQVLCAKFCEPWNDAVILSGHGRNLKISSLLNKIERNRLTVFFCDNKNSPDVICKSLTGLKNILVMTGENLTLENEKIFSGKPEDFLSKSFESNALMLIKNFEPYTKTQIRLRNEDFVRNENIKITQESVRSIILDELRITDDSIFWDIGAGSGSISVSVAIENQESEIHAVDYRKESISIILENLKKFHVHNVEIHESRAKDIIKELPVPTHVFIGGNEGELSEILKFLESLDSKIIVLIECVTLETLKISLEILKNNSYWKNFSFKQISLSESFEVSSGNFTLLKAKSPVYLLRAETKIYNRKNL